jgi:uncharacterized protein (TIGR04255 family)
MDKLKDDPIVEALLEVQFESPELAEVVVGRLSDLEPWKTGRKVRLPIAELPSQIRAIDQQLRFQPTIEVQGSSGFGAVRVGGNVISLHILQPYPGWDKAFPRFCAAIDGMFAAIPGVVVKRLGLRYVNAFSGPRHQVGSVGDLAIALKVADKDVTRPINLTMLSTEAERFHVQTRIVAPQYLTGNIPKGTSAVVDIDVFTPYGFSSTSATSVCEWINEAHLAEKSAFRQLLPDKLYEELRDKSDHAATH